MLNRYAPDQSFDPELANAMGEAFNAAWDSLIATGYADIKDVNAQAARETLALRIIEKAQAGERDFSRLRDDALAYLANINVQKQA